MNSVGILTNKVSPNQRGVLMAHNLSSAQKDYIVFHQDWDLIPVDQKYCMLQINEAFNFSGILIADSIDTATKLANCVCAKAKYFYIWDLEWSYLLNLDFRSAQKLYQNDNIELIARSERHYNILQNVWKKPVGIVEDWNLEQLEQIIEGKI